MCNTFLPLIYGLPNPLFFLIRTIQCKITKNNCFIPHDFLPILLGLALSVDQLSKKLCAIQSNVK